MFSISVGVMLSQQKFLSVQAQHLSSLSAGLNERLTCSCLEKNCSVQRDGSGVSRGWTVLMTLSGIFVCLFFNRLVFPPEEPLVP